MVQNTSHILSSERFTGGYVASCRVLCRPVVDTMMELVETAFPAAVYSARGNCTFFGCCTMCTFFFSKGTNLPDQVFSPLYMGYIKQGLSLSSLTSSLLPPLLSEPPVLPESKPLSANKSHFMYYCNIDIGFRTSYLPIHVHALLQFWY
jgi:hypothetical protein